MARVVIQARQLRKSSTPAERLLWSCLRNQQLYGYKFRRQHPVGNRILDFFCAEAQLAIELDGSGHAFVSRQRTDAARSAELQESGIRVIRFWNTEVLTNVGSVVDEVIFISIPRSLAGLRLRPHLSPLAEGEEED